MQILKTENPFVQSLLNTTSLRSPFVQSIPRWKLNLSLLTIYLQTKDLTNKEGNGWLRANNCSEVTYEEVRVWGSIRKWSLEFVDLVKCKCHICIGITLGYHDTGSQEFHFNNVKKLHLNVTKCTIDPKMPEGNQLTRYLECRGLVRDDDKSIELFK